MTDGSGNRMPETPLPQDGEPPHCRLAGILNALDMAGIGEIDIAVERPPSYPHTATFD